MSTPRNEYPRPQFIRENWINLNGEWEFEIDNEKSGEEKEYFKREHLNGKIIVPFCPESKLSGIGNTDFMDCVWYGKSIDVSKPTDSKRVILHFGAVDYRAVLYVNGSRVGEHSGGYTSFCFDITDYLNTGKNYISLCVYDDTRSTQQPSGKQSPRYNSFGCFYTRTTGIWQTVWIELVDACRLESVKTTTNIGEPSVNFEVALTQAAFGKTLRAEVLWEGNRVGIAETTVTNTVTNLYTKLSEKYLWEPGIGNLYDVKFTLKDDERVYDSVDSYFGLRSVRLCGRAFQINGKNVFGRWVLDQGFYPDGIYTAPNDDALKADIENSMKLGFNGARLHEKIFEPRFLYWADKLGYLVWEEHANWGFDGRNLKNLPYFLSEWIEAVNRDFNHPSLIGYAPFNETFSERREPEQDELIKTVYSITKEIDKTRPVIDTSGWIHTETYTDIYDAHDYEQDPKIFKARYDEVGKGEVEEFICKFQHYDGKLPFFVSEYGGIRWTKEDGWGYGNAPKTEEEFIERYKGLTESLLNNPNIFGFCYTQLYDIEQEQNGLMTYGRQFKFDPEIFKKINTQTAAIEKLPAEE